MKRNDKTQKDQEEHDAWLKKQTNNSLELLATKARDLLKSKDMAAEQRASEPQFVSFDPIEESMRHNPGLTREEARAIAEAFGF